MNRDDTPIRDELTDALGAVLEEGTRVLVKYPAPGMSHETPRDAWPWYPGTIEEVCGPDEWLVTVYSRELAQLEDGSPAPADADDDDIWYPQAFRDSSEIKAVAE